MLDAGRIGQRRRVCGTTIQGGNSNPDPATGNVERDRHHPAMTVISLPEGSNSRQALKLEPTELRLL